MSDFSSQGVGAALARMRTSVSAPSAAAIKKVLVENPVIVILPAGRNGRRPILNKSRTSLFRQYDAAVRRITRALRLCDFPLPTSRLCSGFRSRTSHCQKRHRDDSDEPRHEDLLRCCAVAHDAGFRRAGRRIQAQQQPADCLQPRPGPGQAQHRDLQVLRLSLQHQDLGIFPLPGLAGADARQQGSHQRAEPTAAAPRSRASSTPIAIIRSTPPKPSRRTPTRSSVPAAMRCGPATTTRRRCAAASSSRPASAPTSRNAST